MKYNGNVSWADTRNQANADAGASSPGYVDSGYYGGTAYRISRQAEIFDTAIIPDDAIITGAENRVFVTADYTYNVDTTRVDVVSFAPTNPASLATSDYAIAKWGTTAWATKNIADLTPNAYNTWTLNAGGIANINKTGLSSFGLRCGMDIDNSAPSGANAMNINFYGGGNPELLVVTYTLPGPAGVSKVCTVVIASCAKIAGVVTSSIKKLASVG